MEDIKKYKNNRTLVTFICDSCKKVESKPKSEYDRNIKLGRHNFCSRSCAIRFNNFNGEHCKSIENIERLKKYNDKQAEKLSFNYTLRNCRNHYKEFELDSEYLEEIWNQQKGICPYTKIPLILPKYKKSTKNLTTRASLDRIDSSIGYIKGNVQFISTPINFMKNTMSHEDTVNFLNLIVSNLSFNKDQTISSPQTEVLDALAGN